MTSKVHLQSYRSFSSRIRLRAGTTALALAYCLLAPGASAQAQTFTTLFNFDGTDGANPLGPLVQGVDGDLYGTNNNGGSGCVPYGCGTFFKISPGGTLTTLYNFCPEGLPCLDSGGDPSGGLTLGADGNFYGMTIYGGANGVGTLFKITPAGILTTLYNWCSQVACTDGEVYFIQIEGTLVQTSDGNLYGATSGGGNGSFDGTVFKLSPSGVLTTLYSFCSQSNCPDGSSPSGLIQGTDGNFYGTTNGGGAIGGGTVFKITPTGTLTTLYSFCSQGSTCTDGGLPFGPLIQGNDGNFYGTTSYRGNGASCPVNAAECGTVFRITPRGDLTTIYSFCALTNCDDGSFPAGALVQATDGNFYGETADSGPNGGGTLFKLTPAGVLTTLQSFSTPLFLFVGDGVVQATNGSFYGPTAAGGLANSSLCYGYDSTCGTVFSLSVGLRPFVETQTTYGKVGSLVKILGTDLADATSVTFNGTSAVFTIESKSAIAATVPAGGTSGIVEVTIPFGTLKSNVPFRVVP
jgi:uncharacterized repeat protein (TIGR03803 family)